MSTNFYLCHVPTVREHIEMQELLAKKQYEELKNKIEEVTRKYHIGNRSCGWQFLFEAGRGEEENRPNFLNDCEFQYLKNPWGNNLKSLKEWLSKPEYVIQNEYGDIFTSEQFWNEINECLYNNPEKYINGKQHYEMCRKRGEWYCVDDNKEFTSSDGLRFTMSEFS